MTSPEFRDRMLRDAAAIIQSGPICNACLGRAFGKRGHGWTNEQRGDALRTVLAMHGLDGSQGTCWVCDGLFEEVDQWAMKAAECVSDREFATYLFGMIPTPRLAEVESLFRERYPTGCAEPLKHAFNRTLGMAFENVIGEATVDFEHPDVSFVFDVERSELVLTVASLYIYGRYRKLVRGIPQTHWPCRRCRGRGCSVCGGTGEQYTESVEQWIAGPFLTASGGTGAHLHGAGREDIDARMLGEGRPFVLEIESPRRRSLELAGLGETVNREAAGRIEVSCLMWTDRATVAQVKETRSSKRYRALVLFEEDLTAAELDEAVRSLVGMVEQRTPRRVAHRRADLVRRRRVHEAKVRWIDRRTAEIYVHGEGGLYIKELVSGDAGRTWPSLAATLGISAHVEELDVIEITSGEFPDVENRSMDNRGHVP